MNARKQGVAAVLVLLLGWTPMAHAYIDPGTGSALIQGVIAAVAAAAITGKLYWHRLVNFIGRKKNKNQEVTSAARSGSESNSAPR